MVWYKGHFLLDFVCVVPCVNLIRMGAKNIGDSTKAQINRFWHWCTRHQNIFIKCSVKLWQAEWSTGTPPGRQAQEWWRRLPWQWQTRASGGEQAHSTLLFLWNWNQMKTCNRSSTNSKHTQLKPLTFEIWKKNSKAQVEIKATLYVYLCIVMYFILEAINYQPTCFYIKLTRASVQVTGVIILYLRFVTVEMNPDPCKTWSFEDWIKCGLEKSSSRIGRKCLNLNNP